MIVLLFHTLAHFFLLLMSHLFQLFFWDYNITISFPLPHFPWIRETGSNVVHTLDTDASWLEPKLKACFLICSSAYCGTCWSVRLQSMDRFHGLLLWWTLSWACKLLGSCWVCWCLGIFMSLHFAPYFWTKAAIQPAASRLATCFCFASRCHLLPCVPLEVWNCGKEGSGAAMLRDSPLSSASSVVLSCSLGGHDSRVTQGPYKRKGSWCLSWVEFLLPNLPSPLRSLHYWRSCTTMLPYSPLDGPYC